MSRQVLARVGYALVYVQLVFYASDVTPRTGFIPLDEASFIRGAVAVIGFPGLLRGSLAWLLVLAAAMPLAVGLSYNRLEALLLFTASILVAWMNMIPWRLRARGVTVHAGRRMLAASLAVYAGLLLIAITASIIAFKTATDFITAYFAGLPGDVGLFYGMLESTRLWTLTVFAATGFALFKALENIVLVTTSLSPGGRHLVIHDAVSESRTYSRHLALMEGIQYPILSESFAILISLALYPPLYSVLRGAFEDAGAELGRLSLMLPLVFYFPLWLVVRGLTRSLIEPRSITSITSPRREVAWIILASLFATLIILASYIAAINPLETLKTAITGEPSYTGDPLSGIYNDETLRESITALITALDELGKLLIELLWGG